MNLSTKLILFLIIQALIFTLAITSFVYYYIYPTYTTLEKSTSQQSIHQIIHTLTSETDQFHEFSTSWSMWDELVDYVHTKNQEFEHRNLTASTLALYRLNLVAIYDTTGKRILFTRDAQPDSSLLLPEFFKKMEKLSPELMRIDTKVDYVHQGYWGLYPLKNKVLLVSINPIYPAMPSGAPEGYIMLGRFLTKDALDKLHDATGSNFNIAPLASVSPQLQQILKHSPTRSVNHQTSSQLFSDALISDLYNQFNIIVSLVTPRNLIKQAEKSVQTFIVIGITVGIIFLVGALLFMHYIILKPIHTLRNKMNWMIENQTFEPISTASQNNDEFTDLTKNFNSLIEHVIKQNEALQNLSLIDPLTQLQNRRSLDQFIDTLSGLLQRDKKNLSIMMIDIDHFKLYNDTYGHLQGDEIIIKVAQAIQEHSSRSSDFVARYGGEEFAVILLDTQLESAKIIAETIRNEVASLMLPHKNSTTATYVTISIGLASGLLKDKNAVLHLLAEADDALYDAKSNGRNTVATYHATDHQSK